MATSVGLYLLTHLRTLRNMSPTPQTRHRGTPLTVGDMTASLLSSEDQLEKLVLSVSEARENGISRRHMVPECYRE